MDDYHGHDPPIDPPPSSTTTTTSSSSPTRQRSNYIPRAPNAFILFRSAFIRSQRISGSVEGNHSRLSQIIGSYWNALPAHEKEEWEAKAAVALEEHKRRYPDWRFVNAQAQSRRGRGREGEGRGKRARGRGRKRKPEGERVELIRDLLVEGMEGEELAKAVEDWEKSKKNRKPIASTSAHDPCATTQSSPDQSSAYQTPPASSSSAATSASYPVSSFSSLSGWAGQYPTDVPSPTSPSFPSSSMSPAAYPGFTPYTYYDEFNPPATYEEPMPYDNPYAYPAYSHARQDSGDPTTVEPEFLPYEPVLESSHVPSPPPPGPADIPEIQGQQFQWQAWQPPPPRKGKERAQPPPHPIDEYGWGVPNEDSQPHPNN